MLERVQHPTALFCVESFAVRRAIRPKADALDLRLRLAQLGFAVSLQTGTTLIGLDCLVKAAFSAFQTSNDLLQLLERLLKAHRLDLFWNAAASGFARLSHRNFSSLLTAGHQRAHMRGDTAAQ